MQDIYTDGFLDGLRYSGFLLLDVEDKNLDLTPDCREFIAKSYIKRDYDRTGRMGKLHHFVDRIIKENDSLHNDVMELRKLLAIARQDLKGVDKVKPNYLELV